MKINLQAVDYIILCVYFLFVIGIGWALRKYVKTGADFFLSGRAIPAWVCGLAFISANLGAQEVMGMAASGAQYGIMTSHFYWVGAIPAMVFVGIFMMPFYYGSKARSVPEYLKMRYDEKTRGFNAFSFAVMTVFSSGISMHLLAKLLHEVLEYDYNLCIIVSAAIVLVYIFMGGLTSAIYNEVLQFFMIVFGFAPLVFLGLKNVGGWDGLVQKLNAVAANPANPAGKVMEAGTWTQSWSHMSSPDANPMGVEWFGMVFGLGFVLSFAYWCTDFLVVQRAMAAKSMSAARRTPLIAAVPKMLFPALVILPGMVAIALYNAGDLALPFVDNNPAKGLDYNMTVPAMLAKFFPNGLLGVGLTALMASFMSGMAGNVTAFNTVWTYDIYQSYIRPGQSDKHYLTMGHITTVGGILLSVGCAYLAAQYDNIMNMLQMVFSFVNAPLLATFLLGMFWRRATGHGAFIGLVVGTLATVVHHGLTLPAGAVVGIKGGWLCGGHVLHTYPVDMAQNFWAAIYAWTTCFVVTILVSLATRKNKTDEELKGLVYSLTPRIKETGVPWYKQPATLGIIVLAAAVVLNVIFW